MIIFYLAFSLTKARPSKMLNDLPVHKWLLVLVVFLNTSLSHAQFVEVTSVQNIVVNSTNPTFGSSCSFADFNMDGWPDLSVTRDGIAPKFYQNNNGSFTEVSMGIPNWGNADQKSILWVDYDNDGDRDLFISPNQEPVRLYRNDGDLGALVDITEEAGIALESVRNYGASWIDYDRDGFLDLYICKYHNATFDQGYEYTNHLYRNLGDGTFEDVTLLAGIGDGVKASFQSLFFDYNNDLWPDLYVINDRINVANSLYRNNGDGTFTDASVESGTNIYIDAMCGNHGDFDHDGDLDVYVTNSLAGHQFLINNGDGTFTDQAVATGTYLEDIGWGSIWIDYQNDGWQDLFVSSVGNEGSTEFQNRFFLNLGNGTFIDYAEEVNIEGDLDATYSVAMADFDRDGWVDYFTHNAEQSSSSLWKNVTFNSSLNNWLAIDLQGSISNRDAIGTWLEVYAGGEKQVHYTTCGYNYISQDSFTQHFGLGEQFQVDSVIVKWPSGMIERYEDIDANQNMTFIEGATLSATLNISGEKNLCSGDSMLLFLEEDYTPEWNNVVLANTLIADSSGMYFASVTTPEGFQFFSDTLWLNVLSELSLDYEIMDVSCFGGSDGQIELNVDGGLPPYTIEWNGVEPTTLSAGEYQVEVIDDFDCTSNTSFEILQPLPIDATISNMQIVDSNCEVNEYNNGQCVVEGGVSPYTINWVFSSPEMTTPLEFDGDVYSCVPNAEDLTYTLMISDANSCLLDTTGGLEFFVNIHELQETELLIYPNPATDFCQIESKGIDQLRMYDIQGNLIDVINLNQHTSPFMLEISHLPSGSYHLILLKEDNSESTHILIKQ